jgi:dipeptidyl aminopeptidase/acylaminoacyl peptidase
MHGDADTTVPFHQSELMAAAMQKAKGEVMLIRVPGGGHRFPMELSAHQEWPDVLGKMIVWLDEHLKRSL